MYRAHPIATARDAVDRSFDPAAPLAPVVDLQTGQLRSMRRAAYGISLAATCSSTNTGRYVTAHGESVEREGWLPKLALDSPTGGPAMTAAQATSAPQRTPVVVDPERFTCFRGTTTPRFVTDSERECAEALDFYGVPWEYEPITFVLETDADGQVTEAFSPDFYLPEQNLFLEVTAMRQDLVTRKNRKVRKLRQRYPDVNVKLFYKRDIEALGAKLASRRAAHPHFAAVAPIVGTEQQLAATGTDGMATAGMQASPS